LLRAIWLFKDFEMPSFLSNVNSRSRSLCAVAVARPSSVVCLSATLVRPSQAVHIFGNFLFSVIFLYHLVPWPSVDVHEKFYGDRPRGTPPSGA